MILSACVLGVRCRYDGTSCERPEVLSRLADSFVVIPVCPEQLGGLSTPRPPCRLEGGRGADVLAGRARVVDEEGVDRTENFLRGAEETLAIARATAARRAVLKARSPSCDSGFGVAAARLKRAGLDIEGVD